MLPLHLVNENPVLLFWGFLSAAISQQSSGASAGNFEKVMFLFCL